MKSLIIAPQWIGDAVMTEPLLRTLAARGEKLTVMALPWVAPVYRAMQHIDGLEATVDLPFHHGGLQWQERRTLAARIKNNEWGQFDRAYVLPNSLKSALLPWLANIPERIGYKGEQRFGLLSHRLANPPRHKRGSMVAHYLALASQRGDSSLHPQLYLPSISANSLTLIAPGAEFGPAKRWGEDRFARLITLLLQDQRTNIALLGSAKEAPLCQAIWDKACSMGADGTRIQNLAGKTNLEEAITLIAAARQMVSNDSGLMHVAAAFGIPQVAIFGSSDPRHTPPLSPRAKVLWLGYEGLACTPCFERECPKVGTEHLACMKGIEPARVASRL